MKYEQEVRDGRALLCILREVMDAGMKVLEVDGCSVTVKDTCLPVTISWEMCVCHGGRMWFEQHKTNASIELSSTDYDTDNGITDPETELAWYIENKLVETVKRFSKFVHVVEKVGEYIDEKTYTTYLDSSQKASYLIFEEDGHDVLSEYGEVVHQYPNEDMRLAVRYVGERDGKIEFEGRKLERKNGEWKVNRTYTIRYWVYRKGR